MSAGCIARNYTCHIFLSSMFLLVRLLPSAPCITQVFMPSKTTTSMFFTSHGSPFCLSSLNPCTHWHITRLTLHRNVYKCHKHHHNHKRELLQSLFLNSMFFFPPTDGRTLTPVRGQGYLALRALFHWLHGEWHWTKRQRSTPASAIYRQANEQELVLWWKSAMTTRQWREPGCQNVTWSVMHTSDHSAYLVTIRSVGLPTPHSYMIL